MDGSKDGDSDKTRRVLPAIINMLRRQREHERAEAEERRLQEERVEALQATRDQIRALHDAMQGITGDDLGAMRSWLVELREAMVSDSCQ